MTFRARLAALEQAILPRLGRDTSNLPTREWTDEELIAAIRRDHPDFDGSETQLLAIIEAEKANTQPGKPCAQQG